MVGGWSGGGILFRAAKKKGKGIYMREGTFLGESKFNSVLLSPSKDRRREKAGARLGG